MLHPINHLGRSYIMRLFVIRSRHIIHQTAQSTRTSARHWCYHVCNFRIKQTRPRKNLSGAKGRTPHGWVLLFRQKGSGCWVASSCWGRLAYERLRWLNDLKMAWFAVPSSLSEMAFDRNWETTMIWTIIIKHVVSMVDKKMAQLWLVKFFFRDF